MTKKQLSLLFACSLAVFTGCKEKQPSQDIITTISEAPAPKGPIRMQAYNDQRHVEWLGKDYTVEVSRTPDDSLRMVTDESGQQFVDNRISVTVRRADGSIAIAKRFAKSAFESYLDDTYRRGGILEGLVFDEVDGQQLEFAASVSLPQTDEYIPFEVLIDNFGNVTIRRDSEMDTSGDDTDEDEEV